jgi:hypothetical protein
MSIHVSSRTLIASLKLLSDLSSALTIKNSEETNIMPTIPTIRA